jgi:hypothetical protein
MKKIIFTSALFFGICRSQAQWTLPDAAGNISTTGTGNVGIGTTNPLTKLHVEGGCLFNGDVLVGAQMDAVGYGHRLNWDNYGNTDPLWMARYNIAPDATELRMNISDDGGGNDKFVVGYQAWNGGGAFTPRMTVRADGQVGIGTTNINDGSYKLYVETGIRTRKVKVDVDTWADYVFHPNYRLLPLAQVEKFIRENQHLPDIPSADSVQHNGLDLGSNQAALLKKIEELTLYLIQQDKRLEEQDRVINTQEERLSRLEKLVTPPSQNYH